MNAAKVLVAPDKFKGCLSASEVARHIGRGLANGGMSPRLLPLADGGDGSVDAAVGAGYDRVAIQVQGADGRPHTTSLAFDGKTALVEVANTCGMSTSPNGTTTAMNSSSLGFGQAVTRALDLHPQRVVLALGGSASTDGGMGFLHALGARFSDATGAPLMPSGRALTKIAAADLSGLRDCGSVELVAAADVSNVLDGPSGCATVYGPQKGADGAQVAMLERGLGNFVTILSGSWVQGVLSAAKLPGSGSAGGVGFASALLGAKLTPGADFFLDLVGFGAQIEGAALVITGEGRLDRQTLAGKLPAAVARRAGATPVIAIVGANNLPPTKRETLGFAAIYALSDMTSADTRTNPDISAQLLETVGYGVAESVQSGHTSVQRHHNYKKETP